MNYFEVGFFNCILWPFLSSFYEQLTLVNLLFALLKTSFFLKKKKVLPCPFLLYFYWGFFCPVFSWCHIWLTIQILCSESLCSGPSLDTFPTLFSSNCCSLLCILDLCKCIFIYDVKNCIVIKYLVHCKHQLGTNFVILPSFDRTNSKYYFV